MIEAAGRGRNPFDASGVERGEDGVARYSGRPASLVHLLRASVDASPDAVAVAQVGGERLSYAEHELGALARVRGRADRRGARREHPGALPDGTRRQRLRPHRDRHIGAPHLLVGVLRADVATVPRALAAAEFDRVELATRAEALMD